MKVKLLVLLVVLPSICSAAALSPKLVPAKDFVAGVFSKGLAKSDYETDAQYKARLAKIQPKGEFYLAADPALLTYKYSPEAQGLVVTALANGSGNRDFLVGVVSRDLGSAIEQNAFGARVAVTHERNRFYDLEAEGELPGKDLIWKTEQNAKYGGPPSVGIGLACALDARVAPARVKAKEYTLVFRVRVGDLTEARISRFSFAPTFDAPLSSVSDTYSLPVFVDALLLMHVPTREIVASCPRPAIAAPH